MKRSYLLEFNRLICPRPMGPQEISDYAEKSTDSCDACGDSKKDLLDVDLLHKRAQAWLKKMQSNRRR